MHGNYSKSMFLSPVIEKEVTDIINNLKYSTSTSHEELPVKIIKCCNNELIPILTYLNNSSISEGVFPDLLKIAKIVPIFKSDDRQTFKIIAPNPYFHHFQRFLKKNNIY